MTDQRALILLSLLLIPAQTLGNECMGVFGVFFFLSGAVRFLNLSRQLVYDIAGEEYYFILFCMLVSTTYFGVVE
jgi:hypothetical protein